jgi:hypothetical protein
MGMVSGCVSGNDLFERKLEEPQTQPVTWVVSFMPDVTVWDGK